MIFETEEQAHEVMSYYVELLGLQNWFIKLNWKSRMDEFELKGCCGEVDYEPIGQSAVIWILDPIDYGDRIRPIDHEATMVHELLHLVYAVADKGVNETCGLLLHQNMDTISKAIVKIRRDNKAF